MMVQLITGIDDNKNRTPVAYELYQNYPNPFSAGGRSAFGGNPATTIVYSLPNDDHVILKVYNYLAGR
jgi:hypothetical protein